MLRIRTYKIKARPHRNLKEKLEKKKADTLQARSKFDAELAFKNKHGNNWKVVAIEELCDKTK